MRYKKNLILIVLFFIHQITLADSINNSSSIKFVTADLSDSVLVIEAANCSASDLNRPSPLLQAFRKKQKSTKQTVAALLAFPLPFGIVGLHRIYLGTAPYVPVAYIASLGGMFGIVPFVDFIVLLLNKDTETYVNNRKIFMWVN